MQRSGTEAQRRLRLISYGARLQSGSLDPRVGSSHFSRGLQTVFLGALQGLHWVTGVGKHLGGRASSQPTSTRFSGICQPFRSVFFGSFLPGKHFPVWGTYTSLSLRLLKARLSANHPPKLVLVLCLPHTTPSKPLALF